MILAHLWFNASLLLPQGKPRCGQKDMFTKDDNGGCGFEKSRYPEIYEIYIYIYMHLCLWLSQPSQSNVAGSKRNKIVLIIAEYLHINRHLFFF